MNYRIKDPKQVVLHAQGASGAGFIDGVWNGPEPPKKEWVGLTDEEIAEVISGQFAERNYWVKITKALETKLKEKNT